MSVYWMGVILAPLIIAFYFARKHGIIEYILFKIGYR